MNKMEDFEVLQDENGLQGQDLSHVFGVFQRFQNNPLVFNSKSGSYSRFRKKEALEKMAKSIIKHRIQTLTGQNMSDIESQLGFSIKKGTGISLDQIKFLAHLMILESNGSLHEPSKPDPNPLNFSRKGVLQHEDIDTKLSPSPCFPVKWSKTSRRSVPGTRSYLNSPVPSLNSGRRTCRSVAPEMIDMSIKEKIACRLGPATGREEAIIEEDLTPQILTQNKKSMVLKRTTSSPKKSPKVKKNDLLLKKKALDKGFSGASFFHNEEEEERSRIYLINNEVSSKNLNFKKIKAEIGAFEGFNLAVIHTPGHWQPLDMYNIVRALKFLNKDGKVENYLILVGCGVENVRIFQEALYRLTSHVQPVVFDRQDQNQNVQNGKLRETTSFFLLGYFFLGCEEEESILPGNMVRQGMTNCFQVKSIEDLENIIIHAMSEEGDWILDLGCKPRELSLAAQKTGRFALAFEEDVEKLRNLEQKARVIANHHNPTFSQDDGMILKL